MLEERPRISTEIERACVDLLRDNILTGTPDQVSLYIASVREQRVLTGRHESAAFPRIRNRTHINGAVLLASTNGRVEEAVSW